MSTIRWERSLRGGRLAWAAGRDIGDGGGRTHGGASPSSRSFLSQRALWRVEVVQLIE